MTLVVAVVERKRLLLDALALMPKFLLVGESIHISRWCS
jgi:hypothetical protein